jgi:UbiD family decarboxylase
MHLRPFLAQLEREGKLVRIKKEVSREYEIASIMNTLGEQPVIFDHVTGSKYPIFGGITSNRDIIAEGFGVKKEQLLPLLVNALRHPTVPKVVDKAPCQEVVEKIPNLDDLPLLFHLPEDGGFYATATVSTVNDPQTGRNASYHRLLKREKNKFTARLIKGRQTRTTYDKTTGDLPFAVCIGSSVPVMVSASLSPPSGVDEFSIANTLDPMTMVKCVTNDLEVPSESEFVIEGRLTKQTDKEGPFLDLTETYDFERKEPVFVVDCITHRKDAMYQALIPGRLEHKNLMGMPKEPTIFDEVSKVADCKNVLITLGGGSWLHGIVQIEKHHPDDGKKAIEAAFQGHKSMKHVVIVDSDVDIYSPTAVEWAIATRFQGGRDLVVKRDQPGSSLDPSSKQEEGKKALTDKVGVDATMPADVNRSKYEVVRYKPVRLDDYLR